MSILRYPPLLGGLRVDVPAHDLPRGFSPRLNAMWVVDGVVRRIDGQEKCSTTQVDGYPLMIRGISNSQVLILLGLLRRDKRILRRIIRF